mmetsp:Transcript_37677/g.83909  ORF Transcript_37677/g.83909 Transcript_37677/m.83909 type:complete len:280 (+) Transcript_37677:192-1031(+)
MLPAPYNNMPCSEMAQPLRCAAPHSPAAAANCLCLGLGTLLGGNGGLTQSALLGQGLGPALALLLEPLHQQLVVLSSLGLGLLQTALLQGASPALALQCQRSHQPLDLGGLAVLLAVLLKGAPVGVDVLAHVIILGQVEELADLAGPLGTTHAGLLLIGQAGQLLLTLLDNLEVQNGALRGDDATAHRLAAALTVLAAVTPEALITAAHQQLNAQVGQNTLLHGKTLLVLATSDLEDVALELITQDLAINLSGNALVVEVAQLGVIIDLQLLLAARRRV